MKRFVLFILLSLFINLSYGQHRVGRGVGGRVSHGVVHRGYNRPVSVGRHSGAYVRTRPIGRPVGGRVIVNGRYWTNYYPNEMFISRNYPPIVEYYDVAPSVSVYYEEREPQTIIEHNVTNNYVIREDENRVVYDDDMYMQTPTYTAWTINFQINSFSIITNNDAHTNLMNVSDYAYRYPNSTITLYGYADAQTGNPELNKRLSRNRCITVYNKLVTEYGIDQNRIRIVANGSDSQRYTVNNYNRCVIIEMVKY